VAKSYDEKEWAGVGGRVCRGWKGEMGERQRNKIASASTTAKGTSARNAAVRASVSTSTEEVSARSAAGQASASTTAKEAGARTARRIRTSACEPDRRVVTLRGGDLVWLCHGWRL
jgi:hypothetical protein